MSDAKMTAEESCRQVLKTIADACDQESLARAGGYIFRYVKEETVLRDCGQRGVCRTPPGCARHWEERNRELAHENEVLRSTIDHLSSELREVLDALDGRAVIFDRLGARIRHLLDEMDEWIERAGAAERRLKKAEDGSRLVAREADERMPVATSRVDAQAHKESDCDQSRASCPKADPASEGDDETDIIIAGRQVPFVQVGMIVHPDDCLNCERDGSPLRCSALVCDIHDGDETARFGMMATLLFRNGDRREVPCDELRRRWRLARDFDQGRVYTGRWGTIPRGSVWPVAEVNEDA